MNFIPIDNTKGLEGRDPPSQLAKNRGRMVMGGLEVEKQRKLTAVSGRMLLDEATISDSPCDSDCRSRLPVLAFLDYEDPAAGFESLGVLPYYRQSIHGG